MFAPNATQLIEQEKEMLLQGFGLAGVSMSDEEDDFEDDDIFDDDDLDEEDAADAEDDYYDEEFSEFIDKKGGKAEVDDVEEDFDDEFGDLLDGDDDFDDDDY